MAINNKILLLVFAFMGFLAVGTNAQTERRKPKPRRTTAVTRPSLPPLSPSFEPEVISRAEDDLSNENAQTNRSGNAATVDPDVPKVSADPPTKTAAQPAASDKNPAREEEKEDRRLLDLERLSLAEGRAEAFRKQLSEVIERESNLRSKIEQLSYQMRPEVIQTETSVIGSLRPEELREAKRKMLENEKARTNEQLTKVLENRTRLETAIVNADTLVEKLRLRVEAETDEETRKSAVDKISAKDSAAPNAPDN